MRDIFLASLAAATMIVSLPEASSAQGVCGPGRVCGHARAGGQPMMRGAARSRNYAGSSYGRGYNRGYGGGYGGGYYGDGYGAGVAALAAGALIGGVVANQSYYASGADGGGDAYCVRTYRSYDPASGTYLGYDGLRHPCP